MDRNSSSRNRNWRNENRQAEADTDNDGHQFRNFNRKDNPKSSQFRHKQRSDVQTPHKSNLTGLHQLSQLFDGKSEKGAETTSKRRPGSGRIVSKDRTGENRHNNTAKSAVLRPIGFKKLEEILSEEPDVLIVRLLGASSGFLQLLYTTKLSSDYIVLIMRILSKACASNFPSTTAKVLQMAHIDEFTSQLTNFIILLPKQKEYGKHQAKYFWENPNDFFQCFNNYYDTLLFLTPSVASEIESVVEVAMNIVDRIGVSSDTQSMLKTIQTKIDLSKEEMIAKYKKKTGPVDESELEPPDDFRNMSLYPLPIEIVNRTKAFVRKNIIEGPYKDVEHYLDVQFRLLREDFVKPLREGICDYIEGIKSQNIKIHKNVKLLGPQLVNAVCGILIQLNIKDIKVFKKKMEHSRRFMFGSLMCFTSNNFGSVIFGKIIDRKLELLQKGQMVIEFESTFNIEYDVNYLMVESSVYFEPYYHVLRALKQLHENNFPMKKFIIKVCSDKDIPSYLNPSMEELRDSSDEEYLSTLNRRREIDTSNLQAVQLNEAQHKAYYSAMTESFSIIQGPPGTGKTYLGLIIAKALLEKRSEWYHNRYPLLVVCFTNHALDQFLEGLMPATDQIIRIGGQSKNKNLEVFNIRTARRIGKRHTHAFHEAWSDLQDTHLQVKNLHASFDVTNDFLGIVNILYTLRTEPELLGSWFETITEVDFRNWLFVGQTHHEKGREFAIENEQIEAFDNNENIGSELLEEMLYDPNEKHYVELDNVFEGVRLNISMHQHYLISVDELQKQISSLCSKRNEVSLQNNYPELCKTEAEISSLDKTLKYLQMRMEEGKATKEFTVDGLINFDEPHSIQSNDRWKLYFHWLDVHRANIRREIDAWEKKYQLSYRAYEELREMEDIEIMKKNLVIGMTTTGAARLQGSLRALQSPIVIVEEAAEIMESHVVTSLTDHCSHLILIGDHQQLRPNTADYTMEKKYYLGISLFERMVRNNMHCNRLSVQHRMRPEIAKLIAPNIYPHLENHESVDRFPPVRGVDSCLYFITHEYPEEECTDQSKSNLHEVKFFLRLAKYLLLNGYQPDDITIIAAYSGQMFAMLRERRKFELLKDVRITVLDNYQGEESKIILLSLVRNNKDGKIGFLSMENRVCVALSRAREGLYIMGNMNLLCSHKNDIWPKVRNVLEEQGNLGTSLALRCQIHHTKLTTVSNDNDFQKVSEGGCDLICSQVLVCGHQCKSRCHILNRDHDEYQCKEKCTKMLCDIGHICPKLCFNECGNCQVPMLRQLACGHEQRFPCYQTEFICTHPVSVELPCKHRVEDKPCHIHVANYPCPYPCDTRIEPCGHACTKRCHIAHDPDHLQYQCFKPCTKYRKNCTTKTEEHICPNYCYEECINCDISIKKHRSCSHVYKIACADDVEAMPCYRPCKKQLSCGHPCKLKCNDVCGSCAVKVKKTISGCGHEVSVQCSKTPTARDCDRDCLLLLPCGHKCKSKCKQQCTTQCMKLVDSIAPLPCGHSSRIPCYLNNLDSLKEDSILAYCKQACNKTLECVHKCSGSCADCYQGRVHKICMEECGVDLVCGHKCSVPCRQICPPCVKPCMYKCCHSKCKKKCGDICTPCKEPCPRRCPHVICTARCSDKCTVDPCIEPCIKKLKCGHECIGFCGEPCPPLCIICNRDELLEFCLGYEDEPGARFVLLENCQHVIESTGMEMWLGSGENEINVKRCPKCRMPLTLTRRYNNYIKESIEEVQNVKLKFFGHSNENSAVRNELLIRLNQLDDKPIPNSKDFRKTFMLLERLAKPIHNGRLQPLSKIMGQILKSKIQILEEICTLYRNSVQPPTDAAIPFINFLLKRLVQEENRMTGQEINDFTTEIKRLRRILQFSDIERTYPIVSRHDLYVVIRKKLFSYKPYDSSNDILIKQELENLSKQMGGSLIVTDREMQAIVKAIGVAHGAWYKCPNGHPYAIGDCGGAMVISHCADCGAQIGGRNHALLNTNAHFNVDGSNHAAWSEQANMLNYRLD